MKNIIGNSCVSAFITKELLNQEFINPFCWNTIDAQSMYNLILYYDTLDWNNIELIKDKNWHFYTIIDNKVKIRWAHYIFSKNDNKIRIKKPNVYWNKIWEYIVNEYNKRIERMLTYKIEPIFIIGSLHKVHWYNENWIRKICSIKTNYKIIIVNNNMDFSKDYPNIIFHKTKLKDDGIQNNSVIGKELYNL